MYGANTYTFDMDVQFFRRENGKMIVVLPTVKTTGTA